MDIKKKVEDIFDISAGPAVDIVSSIFLEGVIGTVVPGVTGAMLAYKQKRSERMVEEFMLETRKRQLEFEEKLIKLEEGPFTDIKDKYFGLVLDYVTETKQEEKIKYIVNGFINLADMDKLQEDVVLVYYDLLDELNVLDLRILKAHNSLSSTEGYYEIVEDAGINNEQYSLIQNKLERLGLIETKGQSQYEEMFENVRNIGEYLSELEKGKKGKPRLKFKKPTGPRSRSYSLTKLGWKFLEFFTE